MRLEQGEERPIFGLCRGIYLDQTAHFEMVLALGLRGHSFGPSFICFDLIVLFKFLLFFSLLFFYISFLYHVICYLLIFLFIEITEDSKKKESSIRARFIVLFRILVWIKQFFVSMFFHTRMC